MEYSTYLEGRISVLPKYQSARGHSNETKQDIGSTDFLKASSRGSAGLTKDEEAPATLFHFGLPY